MSLTAVLAEVEARFATGDHLAHLQALRHYAPTIPNATPAQQATWAAWMGFLHSLTGGRPQVVRQYCARSVRLAAASGEHLVRAIADCCLAQSHVMAGDYPAGVRAGHRALATFEVLDNGPWACRTLWHLSTLANAVGDWGKSCHYAKRALKYGQGMDDARIQGVSTWRLGATRILEGHVQEGMRDCEQALGHLHSPFDRAMALGMQGYGLVKAGDQSRGIQQIREVIVFCDTAHMLYTRVQFMVHLAAAYVMARKQDRARRVGMDLAIASQQAGYAGFQAIGRQRFRASFEAYDPLFYEERNAHADTC